MKFFRFVVLLLITACAPTPIHQAQVTDTANPVVANSVKFSAPLAVAAKKAEEKKLSYVRGSTQKVCQVTGEFDRERQQATLSKTESRFGVSGTDLGTSFEHEGKIFFLFGDTNSPKQPVGADSIAYSTDRNPDACLNLQFVTDANGTFLPPTVQGISLGLWEVPTGGFSAHGAIYVFFMTDRPRPDALGRSVLARSDDNGRSFKLVYEASRSKFIELGAQVVENADVPGLPRDQGKGVLLWGTGQYRRSDPYLAYVPLDEIEDRSAWKFFAGMEKDQPRWSAAEADAAPLFDHPCMGEFSIDQNNLTRQWMMFYNCNNPRGINFRFSKQPWSGWSESQVLFNPRVEEGYCFFMHMSYSQRQCDAVNDPGRENNSGGEYAPSVISRFTKGDSTETTVYFLMSTWNPYNVVLMKSVLRME